MDPMAELADQVVAVASDIRAELHCNLQAPMVATVTRAAIQRTCTVAVLELQVAAAVVQVARAVMLLLHPLTLLLAMVVLVSSGLMETIMLEVVVQVQMRPSLKEPAV
jgi:hypothetical protein